MPFVYCKDQRVEQRKIIDSLEFDETVGSFKEKVCSVLGVPVARQEIVYHGILLKDKCTLASYNIQEGETLHVLSKQIEKQADSKDQVDTRKVVSLLEIAMRNPLVYKHSVNKILQDTDALEQIVNATPGLRQDLIAMGLLRNPDLMVSLASTSDLMRVLQEHPCLAHAASQLIASITEGQGMAEQPSLRSRSRREAEAINEELAQMDPRLVAHAELLAAREEVLRMSRSGQQQASPGPSANPPQPPRSNESSPSTSAAASHSPATSVPRQLITRGLFSQAMATAMSSSHVTPPRNAQFEGAVQQIQLMGIQASLDAIRRALMVSEGNVEAAVNLLLEGDF